MRTLAAWLITLFTVASQGQTPGPRDVAPPPTGTATITGRVVVMGGNEPAPVRRARVVADVNGATIATDTDVNGNYRFTNAPAGTYRIRAEKAGFVMPEAWQRGPLAPPAPLGVQDGQKASQNVTLVRGAAFEGRLLNDRGEPAMNIIVSAVRLRYGPYGRLPVPVKQTRTDDRGRYRIHSLPAGEYYIEAGPDPLDVLAQRAAPTGLAKAMYPGTPRVAEAQKMTAAVGADLTGLDFAVGRVELGTLSGVVKDSSGTAVNSMGLRLQRVGGPPGEVRASYLSQTGQYGANGIVPGEYWLSAGVINAAKAPEYFLRRVTMGPGAQTIDIVTAPGTPVSGRVEVAGHTAPLPPGLAVTALETDFELALPQPLIPTFNRAPAGGDGAFTFAYLPSPRLFRIANLPDGWAIANVLLDNADISDAPAALAAGAPAGALRIVVTASTGTVSGTVQDSKSQPVPAARVVVFAEDDRRWTIYSRFIQTVESSATGAYRVAGLLPGKYRAVAVETLDDNAWNDPEVLRALWGRATPIEITAGGAATLALPLRDRP